jgi:hypothetical protein
MRIRGRLLRVSSQLERRTLALGMLVAAAGAVIAAFAWLATSGVPFAGKYPFTVILPADSPPLPHAAQVRIAGKIAGAVTSVHPRSGSLRVNAFVYSKYAPLGRGASVHVGVLIGTTLVYLVVSPGDYHHPLAAGSVIPQSRVTTSSSLPQALQAFKAGTRAALARDITVGGEGWLGRGAQTNTAIGEAPADLRWGIPLLRAAVPRPGVLADLFAALAPVTRALRGERADDNAAGTTAAAGVWQTLAARSRAATATDRFPGAEHQLLLTLPSAEQTLTSATAALRAFNPLARQVASQAPTLVGVLSGGQTLLDATTRFNRYAPAVMRGLAPVLQVLLDPALSLPLLGRYGNLLSANIDAYAREWALMGEQLHAATSYVFGGKPALRITGELGGCAGGFDPYPAPGQAAKDRRQCSY